ncbi:hypothetical protein [Kitasatospora indigofera]|uniref:hypothetical protein n=1 Tax=Kitasatospora indigofera TaxID=67307 RepID=UPI00368B1686
MTARVARAAIRSSAVRAAVAALGVVLLLGGCSSDRTDGPAVPLDRAKQLTDQEFEALAAAFSPGIEWTGVHYAALPDTTGFCGTQGCEKTGRAELTARRWARGRIAPGRQQERLDAVSALWAGRGYQVTRESRLLDVRTEERHLTVLIGTDGCVEVGVSLFDVADPTAPDGSGQVFGQGPDDRGRTDCASADDPYWSH